MNRHRLVIIIGVAGAGVLALSAIFNYPSPRRFYTDGATIRQSVREITPRQVLWTPPEPVLFPLSLTDEDYEPRFSWDGRTLFFVRGLPGHQADIFSSELTPTGWQDPQPLLSLNSPADDLGPELSWEGDTLYFYSNRPGGLGGYDIWYSCRELDGWSEPVNLGDSVNTSFDEHNPGLSPDGLMLYFSSNRPRSEAQLNTVKQNWVATLRQDREIRDFDLYSASLNHGMPEDVRWLATLNTSADEGTPCVSPEGDFLFFSTNRAGGHGGFDLWRSRIHHGRTLPPELLPPPINSPAHELDPTLTAIGFQLYFSSDREHASKVPDPIRDYDIFSSRSHEVYTETLPRQSLLSRFLGVLGTLGWDLFWTLLALLLILALLYLWRNFERRELSLLARCALASLLFHLLLLFLFNSVKVTTQVLASLRGPGEIRVALERGVEASGLSVQLMSVATGAELRPPTPDLHQTPNPLFMPETEPPMIDVAPHLIAVPPPTAELGLATADVSDSRVLPQPISQSEFDAEPIQSTQFTYPSQAAEVPEIVNREPRMSVVNSHSVDVAPDPAVELLASTVVTPLSNLSPAESVHTVDPGNTAAVSTVAAAREAQVQSDPTARLTPNFSESALPEPTSLSVEVPEQTSTFAQSVNTEADLSMPIHNPTIGTPEVQWGDDQSSSPTPMTVNPATMPAVDWGLASASLQPEHDASPANVNPLMDLAPVTGAATVAEVAHPRLPDLEHAGTLPEASIPSLSRLTASHQPMVSESPALVMPSPSAAIESQPVAIELGRREVEDPVSSPAGTPFPLADTKMPFSALATLSPAPAESTTMASLSVSIPQLAEPPAPAPSDTAEPQAPERPRERLRGEDEQERVRRIRGEVLDAQSDEPLSGAVVRLDLPGDEEVTVTTDADGKYQLAVPEVPDFFALSASVQGYAPRSENVPSRSLQGSTLEVDFKLDPLTAATSVVEAIPDVHHLGNDLFEGRINSQFQKPSEGRSFRSEFSLSEAQLSSRTRWVKMTLMTKGIQCPHEIWVNGVLLDVRLDQAPRDGSFGEFALGFDGALLKSGSNTLQIRAVACNGDLDDFEFVNVQFDLQFKP